MKRNTNRATAFKRDLPRGKFIVIEGSDASGKATQTKLLYKFLQSKNIPSKIIEFPRYTDSFFGKFIGRFLQGEFGTLREINPYLISFVYAKDREDAKEEIENWLTDGYTVIANRYVPSNLAHQSGRLPEKKREDFIKWNLELEYTVNKIPRENLVLYLHVPYKVSQKLIAKTNQKSDMVEKDTVYLKKSEEAFIHLSKTFPHWVTIECADKKGAILGIAQIHEEIKKVLASKRIVV